MHVQRHLCTTTMWTCTNGLGVWLMSNRLNVLRIWMLLHFFINGNKQIKLYSCNPKENVIFSRQLFPNNMFPSCVRFCRWSENIANPRSWKCEPAIAMCTKTILSVLPVCRKRRDFSIHVSYWRHIESRPLKGASVKACVDAIDTGYRCHFRLCIVKQSSVKTWNWIQTEDINF